jgi:hypothetical protein
MLILAGDLADVTSVAFVYVNSPSHVLHFSFNSH